MSAARGQTTLDLLLKQLQRIERSKPTEYEAGKAELLQANELFHRFVAERFEPLLNQHAVQLPQSNLKEKQELSRQVNADLRALGLAIKCPVTEMPAILRARPGRGYTAGRFQIELTDAQGRRAQVVSSGKLFDLTLTAGRVTDLGHRSWVDRSRETAPDRRKPHR